MRSAPNRLQRWLGPGLCAAWHVFALARFYRRFVFDEAQGRVFGLADDVYISACFGRSLFSGRGFVWYAGAPKVEGISNPLWSVTIGALHSLPGFSADRLGAFVVALNAVLLVVAVGLFWSALWRLRASRAGVGFWLSLTLLPAGSALAYWSAEGFEVALLAALAFGMLRCAMSAAGPRHAFALGVMLAIGIATRMDFVLIAVPALVVLLRRPRGLRMLAMLAATAGALVLGLLLARHAYYGEWLPNTYYLKATGWPLPSRWSRGCAQNAALLALVPLPWLALLVPALRRQLWHRAPEALAAWFGFGLTVLYSTYLGGDSWRTFAGYDRHTAVGSMLLVWGLCALLMSYETPARVATVWVVVLPIVAWPIFGTDNAVRLREGLFAAQSPLRDYEREWIRYGKGFRAISRPGARIAVCPAGAIIYFSERGGVDLLGKVDPFIARLAVAPSMPKNNRCWRDAPGHNKEDDVALFALRQPEFSRYRPPPEQAARYMKIKHQGQHFFALRATPYLVPDRPIDSH